MSFACPSCGTDYARKLARLETLPPKVRCHRCGTVWQPLRPDADDGTTVETLPPVVEAPPQATARPAVPAEARSTSVVGRLLWGLAVLLFVAAIGGLVYAYRDALPFFQQPAPVLTEVTPAWTETDGELRLEVVARIANDGARPIAFDRVRVKFLSAQRAWIGEVMVEVPLVEVPAGGGVPLTFTVDRVPDGTAALEFVLGPAVEPAP